MSVAIEQLPAPFLVTVTLRADPLALDPATDLAPTLAVRPSAGAVPSGWGGLSASELAELTWEDAAWQ